MNILIGNLPLSIETLTTFGFLKMVHLKKFFLNTWEIIKIKAINTHWVLTMHQAHSKHFELSQRILTTQVTGYYKELIVLFFEFESFLLEGTESEDVSSNCPNPHKYSYSFLLAPELVLVLSLVGHSLK